MSKAQREEAERRSKAAEAEEMLPVLREVSRQKYLEKREAQKLAELKEAIQARTSLGSHQPPQRERDARIVPLWTQSTSPGPAEFIIL